MNYDYKIVNTDASQAFARRVLLYLAILTLTVSLALVVLFLLFERYLMLLIPGALILASLLTMLLVGKRATFYSYHYEEDVVCVENGRQKHFLPIEKIEIVKNAENSDFFNKTITALAFIKNRIILKTTINDNNFAIQNVMISCSGKTYIVALDDYAISLIKGRKK